jgi:DNA-binding NarL/FixJ family response regulator
MNIKVILADNHTIVRARIKAIFEEKGKDIIRLISLLYRYTHYIF